MGKRNRQVSFSQYKLYKKCPLAYKFQYVDKIGEFKKNIHLLFGTAMHDTIQSLIYALYNKDTLSEEDEVNGIEVYDYIIKHDGDIVDFDTDRLLKERMINELETIDEEVRSDRVSKKELIEFYQDGKYIIDYLKANRSDWFTLKNWTLYGVEVELKKQLRENLEFKGYIDVMLVDENGKYHVIDLKTSTSGWGYYQKNDTVSTSQNLLYKSYLKEKLNVPLSKISVEYLVLKRKVTNMEGIPDESRLQRFIPSSGIGSVKKAVSDFENFIDIVFTDAGERRDDPEIYPPNPTKFNCTYCEFREKGVCDFVHPDAKNSN